MRNIIEIKKDLYSVGSKDTNRKIFDSLFPLKKGTTYNSFLIIGSEKIALIDTVDPKKKEDLLSNLNSLNVKNIDYIISNHSEQDHSGSIPFVLEKFPNAKVVVSRAGRVFLKDLLNLKDEQFIIVNDNDELSLGNKTLRFIMFPWAHWPETMLTYLIEDKILFTCDVFGAHYSDEKIWYDKEVYDFTRQYYAEIMMPFREVIAKNLKKLNNLDIKLILPSHGPFHRGREVVEFYDKWTNENDLSNEVTIIYISMHNSTEIAVDYLTKQLTRNNIKVNKVNVSGGDISNVMKNLIDPKTLVIATPTVMNNAHPIMLLISTLIKAYHPKIKNTAFIITYEWSTIADKFLSETFNSYNNLATIKIKGKPDEQDLTRIRELANMILNKNK